jgi:hypothetical protein
MKKPRAIAYVAQSKDDGMYFEMRNHSGFKELVMHSSKTEYSRAGYNPEHWEMVKLELKVVKD